MRGVDDDGNGGRTIVSEAGTFGSDDLAEPMESVFATPWAITLGESYGSDVILVTVAWRSTSRVFDPGVTVQQHWPHPSGAAAPLPEAVLPGDPGYLLAGTHVGQGGYVDLFYSRYVPGVSSPRLSPCPSRRLSPACHLPGQACDNWLLARPSLGHSLPRRAWRLSMTPGRCSMNTMVWTRMEMGSSTRAPTALTMTMPMASTMRGNAKHPPRTPSVARYPGASADHRPRFAASAPGNCVVRLRARVKRGV